MTVGKMIEILSQLKPELNLLTTDVTNQLLVFSSTETNGFLGSIDLASEECDLISY